MELQNLRYSSLKEALNLKFTEFEFAKVFVKRCLVSPDQCFLALLIRCSFQKNASKSDCMYYYQVWNLNLKKCVTSYQIQLTTQISQFKCCFSSCSYYFASFDCNGTVTVASLKYLDTYYTFEIPNKPDWIEKIVFKGQQLFIVVSKEIYIHNVIQRNNEYKFQFDFAIDNFTPLSSKDYIFQNKECQSLQLWKRKDNMIQLKKQISKQLYQEIQLLNDQIIVGQLQMSLNLIQIQGMKTIRIINIEYQFNNIIVDDNIIILNTYRSKCPITFYTQCFPIINQIEVDRCQKVDYEFENMYFYSQVIIGWDYMNEEKQGLFVYRFNQ